MTNAEEVGRKLHLTIDESIPPFIVDPIPAKRGKYLTERFILASTGGATGAAISAVFIEALGPINYCRLTGMYVDLVRLVGEDMTPEILATWDDEEQSLGDPADTLGYLTDGAVFIDREKRAGEPELTGTPIRQEEGESICYASFLWQTVIGMEGVNVFLAGGEGTEGSLKAIRLLQIRLGLFPSPSSSQEATENSTPTGVSSRTLDTARSSGSVRLPADHKPPRRRKATNRP